jgi:hypothetical protein
MSPQICKALFETFCIQEVKMSLALAKKLLERTYKNTKEGKNSRSYFQAD